MKTAAKMTLLLMMTTLLTVNCKKSSSPVVGPSNGTNLIANSSFENNGIASLHGWQQSTDDTTYVRFSTDAPFGGGSFSVSLKNEWTIAGRIWYIISPPSGTHRYRLSVWGKGYGGSASLSLMSGNAIERRKSLSFMDSTWTNASVLDTLTTVESETVIVQLMGDVHQFGSPGYMLFDLCEFQVLE